MGRPSFNEAWSAFGKVNFPVADVGRIIGEMLGKIFQVAILKMLVQFV